MSNIRIIAQDGHKDAVLTATSEALAIQNTQDDRRAYVWRSVDDAMASPAIDALDQVVTAVMPVSITGAGAIALTNTNLTLAATLSVDLKNGGGTVDTVAPVCLGENSDGTTTWVAWFSVETAVDQYEMSIQDPTNPDGYIQVVQILCGPYLEPTYNFSLGAVVDWREDVQHITTAGQSIRSEGTGLVRREAAINLDLMPEADRATLIDELVAAGQKATLFVSLYPGRGGDLERHHQFPCRRTTGLSINHQHPMWWRQGLEFREV